MPSPEEQQAIRAIAGPLRSPTVLELGAHTGEDEAWIRAAFNEPVHYVMVEPDPRNCQVILDRGVKLVFGLDGQPSNIDMGSLSTFQNSSSIGTRRLIVGAVADEVGFKSFNFSFNVQNASRTSGSLRQPSGHLLYFPEIQFPFQGMVQCYTLDWIFEHEWLTKIDLLWVDIQGAENMMIEGGQEALKHTRYLFMEIEKEELYAGEALGSELVAMLPEWKILQQFPYNILMENEKFTERGPR